MRILMISSEAVPFSKSGGLADVTTSLSVALSSMGNEVKILIPNYHSTDITEFVTLPLAVEIAIGGTVELVRFLYRQYNGVDVYLTDHPWFSERKGLYGETSFSPYADNLIRYLLHCKSSFALCDALAWNPHIMHSHDWTTGFVPYLAKTAYADSHSDTKQVFTIHNLAYQGEFSRLDLLLSDITVDPNMFSGKGMEKRVNMLQTGLEFSDAITTVSPTYAQEIQSPEQGCNLHELLQKKAKHLYGILNGIDTTEWNPQQDPYLSTHFSKDHMEGKAVLKQELQKELGLPQDHTTPIISMISRIAEQKGFLELCQGSPCVLEQMLSEFPIHMVIVGTGDKAIEEKLSTLAELHQNLSVHLVFNNRLAHMVEASSDFFLMPSRYEPCGLNQMYSLRYGTLPIARKTGGLADSIVDISLPHGTGILFDHMSGSAIYEAVKRAITLYKEEHSRFIEIQQRGMDVDFSWEQSAIAYMNMYNHITGGVNHG